MRLDSRYETDHDSLEVGQQIKIDGKLYWITKIDGVNVQLICDPDEVRRKKRKKRGDSFWPTLLVILLIVIILRLIF